MTVPEYGFVFAGWHSSDIEVISTRWWPITHLGLPYIVFSAVVDVDGQVVIAECRCDPCDSQAMQPYCEMVHRDLDLAIRKALKASCGI